MLVKIFYVMAVLTVPFFISASVAAEETPVWSGKEVVVLSQRPTVYVQPLKICQGVPSVVKISGEYKEVCLFGSGGGPQLARYQSGGAIQYAYSNGLGTAFYPLRVCGGSIDCVYGQGADALIIAVPSGQMGVGRAVIRDFSTHLTFNEKEGGYFELEDDASPEIIRVKNGPHLTNAVGISREGNWAVIEFHDYGFVRVNLRSLQAKRIVAPGATYWVANDPMYEIAVSNSGKNVAIVGFRGGIDVYEVNDACGEAIGEVETTWFPSAVTRCNQTIIDRYAFFPGFVSAHEPSFSMNERVLTIKVRSVSGVTQASLSPKNLLALSDTTYFAFGDSYTSGEGELSDSFYEPISNTFDNKCHVSTRSYPYLLGRAWNYITENRACSGATTKETSERFRQLVASLHAKNVPTVLSLGIGGNDVGLMGKLKTCLSIGTCEWASVERRAASVVEIHSILPTVIELLNDMKAEFGHSKIALVGYPSIINPDPEASCSPLVAILLDRQERAYITESIRYLNGVLEAAAAQVGVPYVTIEHALVGERLCDGIESAVNAIRIGDDIAPLALLASIKVIGAESFHPTPKGHQLISQAIRNDTDVLLGTCRLCSKNVPLSDYWREGQEEPNSIRQVIRSFLYAKDIVNGIRNKFEFTPGSFKPESLVTLEIHSEVTRLLQVRSKADGSLKGEFTTIDVESGYHTVHAYGTDNTGVSVNYYDFVHVLEEAGTIAQHQTTTSPLMTEGAPTSVQKHPEVLAMTSHQSGDTNRHITPVKNLTSKEIDKGVDHTVWFILVGGLGAVTGVGLVVARVIKSKRVQSDVL